MSLWTGWKAKPPQGTPLDRDHGLCQGLAAFWACNEGAGGRLVDVMNGTVLSAYSYGSNNPWSSVNTQNGIISSADYECFWAAMPPSLQLSWPITIAIGLANIGNAGSHNNMLFGALPTSTGASPYECWTLYKLTNNHFDATWNNGSEQDLDTGTALAANTNYVLAATFTSSNQYAYINGLLSATGSTSSGSGPTYGATPTLALGTYYGGTNSYAGALFSWAAVWNRALSAEEHSLIGSTPDAIWQMFASPIPWWLEASGTVVIPFIAPEPYVISQASKRASYY